MHFSKLVAVVAAASVSYAAPINSDTADVNVTDVSSSVYTPIGLAAAYKTGYFGTALTICDDAVEQNIVQGPNEFDSITPENAMN